MPKELFVKYSELAFEFDTKGNLNITRQTDGVRLVLTISEWSFLLKVAELYGWPVCPPLTGRPGSEVG